MYRCLKVSLCSIYLVFGFFGAVWTFKGWCGCFYSRQPGYPVLGSDPAIITKQRFSA